MKNIDIIKQIDSVYYEEWITLKPKLYYIGSKPYGLIGYKVVNNVKYIASRTLTNDSPFTLGMLRDIMRLNKQGRICLITDSVHHQEQIRSVLKRYNFRYEYVNGYLFSFNFKE